MFGTAAATPIEAAAPPSAPVVDEAALPASAAGYQLFGIIEADVASSARAILGASDGEQREYRVGETMPDGARVHAVRERAVIFDRDGQLERLTLPEPDAAGTVPGVPLIRGRLPGAGAPDFAPNAIFTPPDAAEAPPMSEAPMPPTEVPPPAADAPPESFPATP